MSDPTDIQPVGAFDSTTTARALVEAARHTQLTSDPPTALVPRDSFRELPPGCVVGENYEIDARLGAGAMGEVYAARHVRLGKRVAIKVIGRRLSEDDAAIERFAMEARTLAQIQHPAIVAIEHVGELPDGRAYFVMEFLRGESLFERLQRGRIPLTEALRILDQMARGLEAAHAEGIIHRDLKPENTFLMHLPGEPPAIKLLDFGLAKLAADRADVDRRAERTQSGVAIGTPMYMSPEQARGPDVDHRTDIYALGCVAYELLLGTPPFPHARTAPELYAAHLAEAPPLPRSIWPDVPPQLDLVLFAMLAKDPAHRPTLAQVRAVVADVRTGTPSQRAPTEYVGPTRSPRRRTAVVVVGLLALVGGITIGTCLTARPRHDQMIAPNGSAPAPSPSTPSPAPTAVPTTVTTAPPPRATSIDKRASDPPPPPPPVHRIKPKIAATPPSAPAPADAAIATSDPADAAPSPVSPPKPPAIPAPRPPVDRNQTINPFSKKPLRGNP